MQVPRLFAIIVSAQTRKSLDQYSKDGIDPKCTTRPDFTGRPVYLLDEPEPISELV
jgi:hypothetical protein